MIRKHHLKFSNFFIDSVSLQAVCSENGLFIYLVLFEIWKCLFKKFETKWIFPLKDQSTKACFVTRFIISPIELLLEMRKLFCSELVPYIHSFIYLTFNPKKKTDCSLHKVFGFTTRRDWLNCYMWNTI